jgi:3-phenylpropionate/cinnamic acid dioxygenase small subunit
MNLTGSSGRMLSAADERAIHALLVSYGTAIDQRDWQKLRNCFSTDCEADYGSFGKWQGAAAIVHFMKQAHAEVGPTLHRITNVEARATESHVAARSYVDALLMPPHKDGPIHRGIGYYDDQIIRTDGWRIARRQFVSVLIN